MKKYNENDLLLCFDGYIWDLEKIFLKTSVFRMLLLNYQMPEGVGDQTVIYSLIGHRNLPLNYNYTYLGAILILLMSVGVINILTS